MLTLAVTSSTALVGVALGDATSDRTEPGRPETDRPETDLQVLAAAETLTDRRHAEELTPMVAAVLDEAGVTLADVEQFAVDVGPGRFTGMRVGITTVRTLAMATGRLVVPVTSLEALAAGHRGRVVAAVIDARRAEVFLQRFGPDGAPLSEPFVGSADAAVDLVVDGDLLVGDGADRYVDQFEALVDADRGIELVTGATPSAERIAELAAGRQALPGPSVEPLYLRAPDVQVNIKTRYNT